MATVINGNGVNWPFYTASTTTGSAATINYYVWNAWTNDYTTANTITASTAANFTITQYVWSAWNENHDAIHELRQVTDVQTLQRYTRRNMTDAELKAALEQEKRWREEAEARAKKAEEAKKRAEDLLRTFLSPEQREDLDKKNCFYITVDGKNGKKERYRIDRGSHGNVKQVDDRGSIIRSFCIQPDGVPNGDVLLTQKLWLESSEETREEFWATANITTLMQEKHIPQNIPRKERRRYAETHGLLH